MESEFAPPAASSNFYLAWYFCLCLSFAFLPLIFDTGWVKLLHQSTFIFSRNTIKRHRVHAWGRASESATQRNTTWRVQSSSNGHTGCQRGWFVTRVCWFPLTHERIAPSPSYRPQTCSPLASRVQLTPRALKRSKIIDLATRQGNPLDQLARFKKWHGGASTPLAEPPIRETRLACLSVNLASLAWREQRSPIGCWRYFRKTMRYAPRALPSGLSSSLSVSLSLSPVAFHARDCQVFPAWHRLIDS